VRFKAYIPARYASQRLPGKLLLPLGGKPLIQHVYENASASGAEEVVIATDDERIAEAARGFGAAVVGTRSDHVSGTDRIAEAAAARGESDDTIIVNVQGDEPELPAVVIRQVAGLIDSNVGADIASVCEPIVEAADIDDPNIVKVVRAVDDRALYFSREPIPHARGGRAAARAHYRRHVGIYAYRVAYLRRFVDLPPAALEQTESLEQLRALAGNDVVVVPDAVAECGVGVDTRADFDRLVERWGTMG
jgi:3-deoxy-manno-octulosonate cytidylyltransferase (CMP-KDO synthetase)